MIAPREFYTERIPRQFNKSLALQEQQAENEGADGEAARILASLKSVDATIRAIVGPTLGQPGDTFYLNVSQGSMEADEKHASHPPFLTLCHDVDTLEPLVRESGDSVLGFLGGLAGMQGDLRLTGTRIENLAGLTGSVRFTLTGDNGFSIVTHFGPDPIAPEPDCSIEVEGAMYKDLKSGQLPPQEAFMSGKINIAGDMQMAMQLALAAMTPD
jgi:putative sterol carrier protein